MTITFGGLASGIDTNSIITQLVSVEKQPTVALNKHISDSNVKLSILGDLVSKLQSFSSLGDTLSLTSTTHPVLATSSDPTRISVTGSSASGQGAYSLVVGNLAQAESDVSNPYRTNTAGVAGAGSFDLSVGASTQNIAFTASDTLTDIANRISNSGAGVTASVLFDGLNYQLMVSSRSTGLANGIHIANIVGSDLGISAPLNQKIAPLDASFTLNNIPITRASNQIGDVIPGVTFQLRAITGTGPATQINVAPDVAGLTSKVGALVQSFNAIVGALHSQLSYTGVQKGTNTLFGDTSLQALQKQMGGLIATNYSYTGGVTTPGDIGVSLSKDGTLSFDTQKFAAAVTANPDSINNLMNGSGSTGLVQALQAVVKNFTQAGTGTLVNKQASLSAGIRAYNKSIDQVESRASSVEAQLRKQFAAMEQSTAALQAQSAYISRIGLSSK